MAAVAVSSTAIVAAVYLVAVRTHWGQLLDDVAFERRTAVTTATTQRTDRLLGTISVVSLFAIGGAIVLVALARRRLLLAIGVGIAMSGAVVTTEVLKLRLLTRPAFGDVAGYAGNSFPSGHATIGTVLSLGIVMVAPVRLRRPALLVAALVSTAFGTAVLASGWHRPSDTIGAYFVALAWFAATSAVLSACERRRLGGAAPSQPADPAPSPALLLVAAAIVFGFLMYGLWRSIDATGLHTVRFAAPYVLACVAIDLTGIAVIGGYYVIERTDVSRRPRARTTRSGRPAAGSR